MTLKRSIFVVFQHAATLLLVGALVTACASQPKKYRKKKECDCPKWNQLRAEPGNSVRACGIDQPSTYFCHPRIHIQTFSQNDPS